MNETYSLFWNGPYSQWHPSPFRAHGRMFTCAEQYMMAGKALVFDDAAALTAIMATNDPSRQKAIGRMVRGFNADVWRRIAVPIVYAGNICKFTQNPALRRVLMADPASTIVEASPYDTIWGIGLSQGDPRARDRASWRGQNLLGIIIGEVRDFLRGCPSAEHGHRINLADDVFRSIRCSAAYRDADGHLVRIEAARGAWKGCRITRGKRQFLPNLVWENSPALAQARLDGLAAANGWTKIA